MKRDSNKEKVTPMRTFLRASKTSVKSKHLTALLAAGITILLAAPAGACPPVTSSRTNAQSDPVVRDHRTPPAVRDHRAAAPVVRDHRDRERMTGSEVRKQTYVVDGRRVAVTQSARTKKVVPAATYNGGGMLGGGR